MASSNPPPTARSSADSFSRKALQRFRPEATSGQVVVAASLYWTVALNDGFFRALVRARSADDASAWGLVLALAGAVFALNLLIAGLPSHRRTVKPVVVGLTLAAASGSYFVGTYGVTLDPSMMRSVLNTHATEARELLNPGMAWYLALHAGLPLLLLSRVHVVRQPWRRALGRRVVLLVGAALAAVLLVWSVFQPVSSLMRNQRGLRYLITPANLLWSTGAVLAADARGAARPREAIGLDARPGASWAQRSRPLVVVLVVGETARAANWGLDGYTRQTTPELAQAGIVNFTDVTSCGTDTETSLPCMFAPVGRRRYDGARIRGQESLLHAVTRAGVKTDWRDNQSGCKGVCDGLPAQAIDARRLPALCTGGRCLDEALTQDLAERLKQAGGTQLWVLHMLGNHGPSYFRRYPPAFARHRPDCRDDDLHRCTTEQVVNAYDNALLYTDHVLASALRTLKAASAEVDTALLYVSDHGESLGEHGLYLHGMPWALAPEAQKRVPMVWWNSPGFDRAIGLPAGCLMASMARQAAQPVSHDHLFHTLLGALDVDTALHEPSLDLTQPCRSTGTR